MAAHTDIYTRAYCYDVVFRRDVSREVSFLIQAFEIANGRPPRSMVDVACGPGYHAREFAGRGIESFGVDISPEMVEYARRNVREGVSLTYLVGDMRTFRLPRQVDLAFIAYDGIDAMTNNRDLVRHFRCMARNLNPGGLYLIDCIHPKRCSPFNYGQHHHSGREEGLAVELTIGGNNPEFDLITGVGDVEYRMIVHSPRGQEVVSSIARERIYSPQTLELLADRSGAVKVAGWYGDFEISTPLDNTERSTSMIAMITPRIRFSRTKTPGSLGRDLAGDLN